MDRSPDYGLITPVNIDTGMAVVIIAVLIFYLRLIVIQRERAKRAARAPLPAGKGKKKTPAEQPDFVSRYSILSRNRRDLVIAGIGIVAIVLGILLNSQWIAFSAGQPYWWLPTALGIVAFSWAFKL